MKLQKELSATIARMEKIKPAIIAHGQNLKIQGGYKDFETRFAWDALRGCTPSDTICEWYDKYNCTDTHISTMARAAVKSVINGGNEE